MASHAVPSSPEPTPDRIVLFDGHCNLCNASVDWIIRRDRRRRIHFASLQSELGRRLMADAGMAGLSESGDEALDTVLYWREGKAWIRSDASLRVAQDIGGLWGILGRIGLLIPRAMRDRVYRWIARNRIRWFGRRESCRMPTETERGRLLG
jgi:predicted DCC family thiol-disulfide oxidoreductase YuxK